MSHFEKYDIVVIGAGPGGYVAAIKAAQAGKKTLCIDKAELGGICLNWGCIPTKALLKSAELMHYTKKAADFGINTGAVSHDFAKVIARSRGVSGTMTKGIEFLFKKNKVEFLRASARVVASNLIEATAADGSKKNITCDAIVVATGASPAVIPAFPVDGKNVISYRQALECTEQPKKLLVIGAGAIGVEFSYFFNAFGTEVTIVEALDQLLPVEDKDSGKVLKMAFKKQGITSYTSSKVKSVTVVKDGVIDAVIEDDSGKEIKLTVDRVLVAIGMKPNTAGLGLAEAGVALDARGFVKVNEFCQTSSAGIYAIGDCAGRQLLAHKASFEGEVAIAHILNPKKAHGLDYGQVPGCTYCQPQVASVGLTEAKAKELGREVKIGKFPFTASGKAQAIAAADGFVKLIFDAKTDALIGAHIVGIDATEMIAELSLALKLEATAAEIGATIHAHPTLAEAIMEAALDAHGEAVHI
ncbi:MAG: hypothetical protein RL095_2568 [Verrucomicrobiota bacterium]|jgi:dihydrolipoamide dehydrogenase